MLRGALLANVQLLALDEIEEKRRSWRALIPEADIKIRHEHHCATIG